MKSSSSKLYAAGLVQVRGGRHDRRRHRRHPLRLHTQRPRLRHFHQQILGSGVQEGEKIKIFLKIDWEASL